MAKRKKRAHKRKKVSMVSVAAACAAIRSIGRRKNKNPLRHFPKLKGRGRPVKLKTWDMVTRLTDGKIAETSFKASKSDAFAKAQRIARRTFHGKRVAEVVLDDRR